MVCELSLLEEAFKLLQCNRFDIFSIDNERLSGCHRCLLVFEVDYLRRSENKYRRIIVYIDFLTFCGRLGGRCLK